MAQAARGALVEETEARLAAAVSLCDELTAQVVALTAERDALLAELAKANDSKASAPDPKDPAAPAPKKSTKKEGDA